VLFFQLVWSILKQKLFTWVSVKVVYIYLAALLWGKYPPLLTSTSVNNIQLSPKGEVNSDGYILRREASRYMLQVEFDFRSKWFNLRWCVISLYSVFIIIKKGKEITNQPRLKSFWPEIKLNYNIYIHRSSATLGGIVLLVFTKSD